MIELGQDAPPARDPDSPAGPLVGYAAGQRALARRPPCGVLLKIRALELPLIDRSRAATGRYSGNA